MKRIFACIECDYLQYHDEKLFNITEKYTIQSKLYAYIVVCKEENIIKNNHI